VSKRSVGFFVRGTSGTVCNACTVAFLNPLRPATAIFLYAIAAFAARVPAFFAFDSDSVFKYCVFFKFKKFNAFSSPAVRSPN